MKIIKLAAGGPPPGFVRVRYTFKKGRELDVRIVAHGPKTECGKEDDASLLRDLIEAEVPGFGRKCEQAVPGDQAGSLSE